MLSVELYEWAGLAGCKLARGRVRKITALGPDDASTRCHVHATAWMQERLGRRLPGRVFRARLGQRERGSQA